MSETGFRCRRCGRWHDELPLAWHAEAPAYWRRRYALRPDSELAEDQCIIHGEHFFIRALVQLPVVDGDGPFEWGVWVSLSRESFDRASELWHVEGRESEPPSFGWLSTELTAYEPTTLNLPTLVHTRPVGLRPIVEVEQTGHPLAVEQADGITTARVHELAERLLHG